MTEHMHPDDAAQALTQIRDRQEQVVNVSTIPGWYWWLLGALMVGFAVAVDGKDRLVIGIAVPLFVIGVLAATGWIVRGALHVQPRRDLLGARGVLLILALVATVVIPTLALAFGLKAAGIGHPATWGTVAGALLLATGGPLLTRALRRIMLANRDGGPR